MSKTYDFLKECGYFYVLTMNGDFPAGRPFGAVMEYEDKLYISTNDGNSVHKQLRDNGNIQIIAKKGSRSAYKMKIEDRQCGSRELEFAIFCIENVASRLNVDAQKVYAALTEQTDILKEYIIPEYEVLHTQSKDYIVDDIIDIMKERGVKL